jgi:predicted helicase
VKFLVDKYNQTREHLPASVAVDEVARFLGSDIKWTRKLKKLVVAREPLAFDPACITRALYRPFFHQWLYFASALNEDTYKLKAFFDKKETNAVIVFTDTASRAPFSVLACDVPFEHHLAASSDSFQSVALKRQELGQWNDNITDWALKQFRNHYKVSAAPANSGAQRLSATTEAKTLDPGLRRDDEPGDIDAPPSPQPSPASGRGGRSKAPAITKEAIFHYVYAVLHDPVYREKYAQNLKREFPRIPFYPDFWRWAQWGRELMDLHIGYESVEPWPLTRIDIPDENARKNGVAPKARLKADQDDGRIVLDSETTLAGIPPEAWDYKLGNRCALEWILDQYKEKTPKDPTIRAKFNTYRFTDYKDKVIDLLARVTRVSLETQRIATAMRGSAR